MSTENKSEKADREVKELVEIFRHLSVGIGDAKEGATIVCNKIIKELENLHKPEYTTFRMFDEVQMDGYELLSFYQSVKQSIQKL